LYGPILKALSGDVQLVAVWGRSTGSARKLGEALDVPWYTDLGRLVKETSPVLGIVSVEKAANGIVGLMSVEAGLHVLLETPIAVDLKEADAIIDTAREKDLKIEMAEQFHRRPNEQIKLKLIEAGIFGKVYSSFNDFGGHAYHGVSVMRSYLGFDTRPISITGLVKNYELSPHLSRLAGTRTAREEIQEHGIIQFEGDRIGIFHWTSVAYDSALRWWRSSRFLAEKGMGITIGDAVSQQDTLSILAPGGEGRQTITLERRWERIDGGPLESIVAHTGQADKPLVKWKNPIYKEPGGSTVQWHDDEIAVADCLLSLVNAIRNGSEPTYGALQGRLDQEIYLAFKKSSDEGGHPVSLPMEA
ncbi:Gfo/Idh/MocA family protein, partial [Bacteroidota bacterium]